MANIKEHMLISILLVIFTCYKVWANGPNMEDAHTDQKLAFLMAEFKLLKQEMGHLTKAMETMKLENTNLKREMEHMQLENGNVMNEMQQMKVENGNLKNGGKKMNSAIQNLTAQNMMLSKKVQKLENKELQEFEYSQNKNLMNSSNSNSDDFEPVTGNLAFNYVEPKSQSSGMNSKENTFVAFMAYPSETRDYNDGDRVLFDVALRNYGDSYNASDSTFVCPVTGYYLFTITVRSHISGNKNMHGRIVLDEEPLMYAYADGMNWDQGSTTVLTLCEAAHVVSVECTQDDDQLYEHTGSSFTGVLLRIA